MYPWCRETMTTQLYGNAVPSAAAAAAAIKTESGYGDCMLALDYAAQSKKAALVWPSQQDPSAPKSAPGGSPLGGGVVGGGGGPLVGGLHHHHHQQHQQHHHQQLLHHGGGQQGQQGAPPPHHGLSASAPPPPAAAAQGLAHWMSVMAEQINPHHEVHYMATWNGVEQCASPHAKEAEMSWPPPRHGGVFGSKYGYEAKMNSADLQGNQSGPKGEGSSDDGGGGGGRGMEPPGPSPYGGGGGPLLLPAPHAPSHPQHRSASADGGGGMLSGGVSAPVSPSHGPASPATSLPPLDAASKAGGSPVPPGGLVPPHSHPPSANGRKFQCKGRGRKRSRGSQQIQGIGRDGPLGWPGMEQGEIFPGSKGDLHHHLGGGGGGGGGGNREAKPYKCTQCSKAFANSSYLSQHTRIHLGIKPYRCEICQRKFTQLSHLQQHIRTHTGDKPYKCRHPGCPKAFSQLSNLQSHSRCHQTDKPFKCNSCYKCFSDEPSLLEHIPKHRESKHLKTHICQYCGKSYTQETYLAKHMQKHAERTDRRPPIPRPPPQPASSDAPPPDSPPPGGPTPSSDSPHDQQPPHRATPAPSNGEPPDASQPPAQPLAYWHGVRPEHAVDSVMGTEGLPPEHRRPEHHMQHQLHQQAQQYEAKAASSAFTPIHASPPVVSSPSSSGMVHHPHHHPGMGAHPVGGRPTPPSASYLPYDPISLPKAAAMAAMDNMKSPLQHHHPHHHPHHPHHHPHHPHHLHHLPPASSAPVTSAPSASFPNQLISLHQIRNYAHQPSTVIGEHLLGLKEKGQ